MNTKSFLTICGFVLFSKFNVGQCQIDALFKAVLAKLHAEDLEHVILVGNCKAIQRLIPEHSALSLYENVNVKLATNQENAVVFAINSGQNVTERNLKIMSSTVTKKPLLVETGLYDQKHKIIFFHQSENSEQLAFHDPLYSSHGQAGAFRMGKNFAIETRFNPFLKHIHSRRALSSENSHEILEPIPLRGFTLKHGVLFYSLDSYIMDFKKQPTGPRDLLENHAGVAIDFWETTAKHFNMEMQYLNPPDMQYAPIYEDR